MWRHPLRLVLLAGLWCAPLALHAQGTPFIRGDINFDAAVDISDPIGALEYLFLGEPGPEACLDALDMNDDTLTDVSDPIYALSFLFTGSTPIPEPYPDCGFDITPDDDFECIESSCLECLDQSGIDLILEENIDSFICLESPLLTTELAGNDVVVCPPGSGLCPNGRDGCTFFIDEVNLDVDREGREVTIQMIGHINSLELDVDPIIGGPTRCDFSVDLDGQVVIPFTAEELPGGELRILSFGDGVIDEEATVLELGNNDPTPSLICSIVLGLEEEIQDLAIAELGQALNEELANVTAELVGTVLCPEP